jgi:NitT/TauT family transport system substrate-binding protein
MTYRGLAVRASGAAMVVGLIAWALLAPGSAPAKSEPTARSSATLTHVILNVGNTAGVAALTLGKEKGIYKKQGIDLEITDKTPPAQVVGGLLSNRSQFSAFSWGAMVNVVANGVPLSGVANLTAGGKKDDTGVFSVASGPVKKPADLRGKTIAVSVLNGLGEVIVRNLAGKAGVPQNTLHFVALNFPDMGPALRAGRIDAAYLQEPSQTVLNQQTKLRRLGSGLLFPKMPVTNIIAANSYIKSQPKVVAAFQRATRNAIRYARAHPDKIKKIMPKVVGFPASTTNKIVQPTFSDTMNVKQLQRIPAALFRFGKTKKLVQINEFIKKY